jgi:hypothetical protein
VRHHATTLPMKSFLTLFFISVNCFLCTVVCAQTALSVVPVVVSGNIFKGTNLVPGYENGYKATDVVGFIYAPGQTGNWQQAPVQVDERDTVNGGQVYNTTSYVDPWSAGIYGSKAAYSNFKAIQYCDSDTFTGPDHDPTFDPDDELAFMARDAGSVKAPASAPAPAGVDTTSGVELKIAGPNGQTGYLYLFNRLNNALLPSAGKSYITSYVFNFSKSGVNYSFANYKAKYNTVAGPNPERSYVSTPYYQRGFADRWIDSILIIKTGNTKTINLYDKHTVASVPGDCIRSEYTFSGEDIINEPSAACNPDAAPQAEGNFVTNKAGPIRVIRSVMGANSGPLTQRTHIFYDQLEIITTYCRVHTITSYADGYDYNRSAGIMYYNDNNNNPATQPGFASQTGLKGIVIDGVPDNNLKSGHLIWELVNSTYGSIFRYDHITANLPLYGTVSSGPTIYEGSYYLDDVNAQAEGICQCTGDGSAWGTSGTQISAGPIGLASTGNLPYTDPRYSAGPYYTITGTQTNFYLPSSSPQADTAQWIGAANYLDNPPAAAVSNWPLTYANYSPKPVILIYPNPNSGVFNIVISGKKGDKITATIYNSVGKKVCSFNNNTGYLMQTVDLQAQRSGFYIARIVVGTKVFGKKILVNK